jgi:Tol biopolymer transport system component/DNA-binding winged helix-turn-helix (wHTH) protein
MTSTGHAVIYDFGDFRLDSVERVLTRAGTPVPLAPKVIETLLILVERAGHLVTKEELMTRLWPDTFVDESNLAQNVFRLRKALGGTTEQTFIETVPKRGYRFTSAVSTVSPGMAPAAPIRAEARPMPLRRLALIAAAAVLIVAAAVLIVAGSFAFIRAAKPERDAAVLPSLEKLTTDSRAWDPAISPDGRFVAYAVLEGEAKSMWVKTLGAGRPVQVMPSTRHDYRGLRFSPNGSEIFYKTFRDGAHSGFIDRVPFLGGAPQHVASGVWSDFTLSPDGSEVAFVRGSTSPDENTFLVVARVNGGGERIVARSVPQKSWFDLWDVAPSWSADGQHVAVIGGVHAPGRDRTVIFDAPAAGGATSELRTPLWAEIDQVAWLGDGSTLVAVAREGSAKPAQIWTVDVPSGRAHRVTNDLNDYGKLSVTADARMLVVEQRTSPVHVWHIPDSDSARARQLTFGASDDDGYFGLGWTPDERILFVSNRTGEYEIWSMKPDGSDARQLTVKSSGWNRSPRATSDGRYIVFASNRTGETQVWRMNADGTNPLQLTHGHAHHQPELSRDGLWVFATDVDATPTAIDRIPISGGATERVAVGGSASVSPDGSTLAYRRVDARGSRSEMIPIAGGALSKSLTFSAEREVARWSPDGAGIVYINPGTVTNLWLQPIDGAAPRQLTHFPDQHIWNFAFAANRRNLAVARGIGLSDVVLLSNFRPR